MTNLAAASKKRIDSIDILRGIVMVIMALDHTRDFFTRIPYDAIDLTKASSALFLTRFITHYCAATFMFLAGTGAFLYLSRGKSKPEAFKFLLSRGVWLIILELTVIYVAWGAGLHFLQVIWAIGVSMIVLGFLIWLPVPVIAAIGLILILGHNAFDHVNMSAFSPAGKTLWTFLHVQGTVNIDGVSVFIMYPLIPWIGVMAVGYSFGTLFTWDAARRKKTLIILGCSALVLFVILRYFRIYGDPFAWSYQGNIHRTILSFIDVQKYPPSLDYLLITLGPGMILLAFLEGVTNKLTNILLVYGRVPMFYYILHLYLIHLFAIIGDSLLKKPADFNNMNGLNFSLPVVFLIWLTVVFILYFPCRWYMKYKREHKYWWLSYL